MALLDKPTGKMMNTTINKDSFSTPPTGDPGGNDMVDDKDKDNPGGGNPGGGATMDDMNEDNPGSDSTDDDPFPSNKVVLDGNGKASFGIPLPGDPGGDDTMDTKDKDNPPGNDTMDYKDKDNPGSGNTDDDPPLLNMVNLDGSSANNNPGSGDFNILNQLVSSDTQASRFSTISVTMALLDKPTGKMMNTTMNKDSFGTPPTGDPGGNDMVDDKDKDNPGSGNSDDVPPFLHKVNLDGSSANDNPDSRDFNIPNQLASLDTSASRFSLISVTKALLNKPTGEVMNTTMDKDSFGTLPINDLGNSDLYAGLRWTDVDCTMRSYVHNCGG